MKRQVRRLRKAIDEVTKILNDNKGNDDIRHILDLLYQELNYLERDREYK